MTDLERRLRDILEDEGRSAPAPHEPKTALRRARRRQVATVAASALAVATVIAVAAVAIGAVMRTDEPVFADRETVTQTMNGITITFPQTWSLTDPDEAGFNSDPTTTDLPRLVLFLSAEPADYSIACPGLSGRTPGTPAPTFVMTVQEQPLALSGPSSAPWPVELTSAGTAGDMNSGCYPGWQFREASWTAEGRTFTATVGLAPDVSPADVEALETAFASMTFEPGTGDAASAVLERGTTAGEDWSFVATRTDQGLELSLEGDSFGAGIGGFQPDADHLQVGSHAFGSDALAIFGAVPTNVARIEAVGSDGDVPLGSAVTVDVPDEIDAHLDAFILVVAPDRAVTVNAFDAAGDIVLRGSVGSGGAGEPVAATDLEDGRHFGFITAVDPDARTIEFDLAYFLSGEEANRAYQEATGETGPVPNDHFVVNDNPKLRKLTLAPDLRLRLLDWNRCCDTFFDGDLATFAEAIARQERIEVDGRTYEPRSSWWITVKDGVVTEIEEQYSP